MDCIFCKIVSKEMPSQVLYETESLLVIADILPKAPVHALVMPKRHIVSIATLEQADKDLVGDMLLVAQKIAQEKGISEKGYKLVFNVGKEGGQIIPHLHLHLLGGKQFAD